MDPDMVSNCCQLWPSAVVWVLGGSLVLYVEKAMLVLCSAGPCDI